MARVNATEAMFTSSSIWLADALQTLNGKLHLRDQGSQPYSCSSVAWTFGYRL